MSLAAMALRNRAVTYFFAALLLVAGTASFFQLGQLEDPQFTVKTAVVVTTYPGASPEQVELEVTDRIELAIQEMPQIDYIESFSRPGVSLISVNIKSEYWSDRLPQVWDELRRKVRDIEHQLPPGVDRPEVSDDFGDVFGFQLAVTGDGFSSAELEFYAKGLRKELSLVEAVARVDLWGVQQKVIYIDVAQQQLAALVLQQMVVENLVSRAAFALGDRAVVRVDMADDVVDHVIFPGVLLPAFARRPVDVPRVAHVRHDDDHIVARGVFRHLHPGPVRVVARESVQQVEDGIALVGTVIVRRDDDVVFHRAADSGRVEFYGGNGEFVGGAGEQRHSEKQTGGE